MGSGRRPASDERRADHTHRELAVLVVHVHLEAEDAYTLLRNSLQVFRDQHGHWPARVVLHKTSAGFDVSLGESLEFTFGRWVTAGEVATYLENLPHEANAGDVYCVASAD